MTVEASERDPERVCNTDDCNAWKMGDFEYCRNHKGVSDDGESHEGNQNAVSHGLYAETNNFYQEVMTDKQRRLCDEIFQDYCTQFRERNGEPHQGELSRLFEIAVNHIKIIHSDNWATDKPDDLESGNPMVDKGERFNTEGVPYQEYTETVVLKGQQRLRNSDRQWLKDYNLMYDADHQMAEGLESLHEKWVDGLGGGTNY